MKGRRSSKGLGRAGAILRRLWQADRSLSARARGLDRYVDLALLASAVLFGLGITLPVMTVTELWVFENDFSILVGIRRLWAEDERLLAGVIGAFSILFPVSKILLAWIIWQHADTTRRHFKLFLRLLVVSGRWSMADLFVIAIAIMIAKIAGLADAASGPGLYFFAASLVLVAFATLRIERAGERRR